MSDFITNAELRIEAERLCDENDQLKVENVKLRELCKELAEFLTEAEWLQWPELRAELRELGVEAD
jgi:regulator of replication initiation timing